VVAVDREVFKRAGLDPEKSQLQEKAVKQLYDGDRPQYEVKGDEKTMFNDICPWENMSEKFVKSVDYLEELYIPMAVLSLNVMAEEVDFNMFPPRNIVYRILAWLLKKLWPIFRLFRK